MRRFRPTFTLRYLYACRPRINISVNMSDLSGKVALITGASSGIGAATAILFARLGVKLSLTGRNEVNLQRICDECARVGPADTQPPLTVVAELSCEADVINLVDATVKKFGRLDILVNNAGIAELGTIETTSLEQYDRVMGVNVRAAFQLTMLCAPHLIATGGNVVNVSGVSGTRSIAGFLVLCMSKSAVDQMTSCTALELAPKGVRVNSVNPGVIVTEGFVQAATSVYAEQYAEFMERQKETHPLGRVGEAEEVAQAITFLASSNSASFITGQHLHVDGGLHLASLTSLVYSESK